MVLIRLARSSCRHSELYRPRSPQGRPFRLRNRHFRHRSHPLFHVFIFPYRLTGALPFNDYTITEILANTL